MIRNLMIRWYETWLDPETMLGLEEEEASSVSRCLAPDFLERLSTFFFFFFMQLQNIPMSADCDQLPVLSWRFFMKFFQIFTPFRRIYINFSKKNISCPCFENSDTINRSRGCYWIQVIHDENKSRWLESWWKFSLANTIFPYSNLFSHLFHRDSIVIGTYQNSESDKA